jgi:hypothetical protein
MTVDFSSMTIGAKPVGFTEGLTGQGEAVCWQVLEDSSDPGGRVIAETSRDTADYRFPLCIYDAHVAKDVEVSARFQAVDGVVDQAAGLIVRAQDHLNYYVARANALEGNIRLYKVMAGVRRQITGRRVEVTAGVWHSLSLKIAGDVLEVAFDGQRVLEAQDATFLEGGKVGLWTKADSLSHFANFVVRESARL